MAKGEASRTPASMVRTIIGMSMLGAAMGGIGGLSGKRPSKGPTRKEILDAIEKKTRKPKSKGRASTPSS